MIVYFADRNLNVLGQASTGLPGGVTITDDRKTDDVETGVSIFECKLNFDSTTRLDVEAWTEVGNYLLYGGKENKFYTIIDAEIDTNKQTAYVYAEDDGMDLLNDVAGAYTADKAYPIAHYISMWATGAGWEIGINEIENLERQLSWDSESTATARIASIAEQFDNAEISYSFAANGFNLVKKYINVYQKRGTDTGVTLRLNYEIDSIVIAKSISNLATALHCTGGTPDDADEAITLDDYAYDDGDFYVDGTVLKSRNALDKWSRYFWRAGASDMTGGHITKMYSCDALSKDALFASALEELKKCRDMEVNYEAEIKKLPDNLEVGDRVNIVDDAGQLYLSTRLLTLETSVADQTCSAVFGEHIIKTSGISDKVVAIAAQLAATSKSAARAVKVAENAKGAASDAQAQAETALSNAKNAQGVADEAKAAAETATQSASEAQAAAGAAQAAVDVVEQSVSSLQTTVDNAQAAADNAQAAAETATTKAEEAKAAADKAAEDAATAKANSETAQSNVEQAIANAETAQKAASDAKTAAENASATAAAAKEDAEQAKKDIAAVEDGLETVTTTMQNDYARKTELTETTATLQAQITQNAGVISSTVSMLSIIDETANDAETQVQKAQARAEAARNAAAQAAEDAQDAQNAADAAAQAAEDAQDEADTAQTAADTAQSVVDNAKAALAAAKADLETVMNRADATEAEIAQARAAVETAQRAADDAQAEADIAIQAAAGAQATANAAANRAEQAQAAANAAASYAKVAQSVANEAANAAVAQSTADGAAETAAEAQRTADTATTNAANAQAAADAAAQAAANAQIAADDAAERAEQAESDLATAQQNLADVTERVDATAEEVAAAQTAVETAQAAADKAKRDAAAAQSTADTAKENAATAQTAANDAKTAADNAQKAAEDAQAAADKAQDDVDKLSTRVTTMGTVLTQTREQIALMATKEEVTTTLGGYYNKTQTDAKIELSANNVTTTVRSEITEAVAGIEVGGRNLLLDTGTPITTASPADYDYQYITYIPAVVPLDDGKPYTVSADVEVLAGSVTNISVKLYDAALQTQYAEVIPVITDGHIEATFPAVNGAAERLLIYAGVAGSTAGNSVTFSNVKFEKGNKATDWTPAPEDVQSDTDNAQAAADALEQRVSVAEATIQHLADSIAMLVRSGESGSLLKQDANGLYYFDISGIEQNIEDTASGLDDLSGVVLNANGEIDVLKTTAAALQERTEYVRSYTDENDNPCLELGEGDSQYKVYITNMGVRMEDGTEAPAVVSKKVLRIEKTVVRNELQFGDEDQVTGVWIWKRRANGNLGLSWKSVALITFTIYGNTYQAVAGMTWAEWCDSQYNTNGYYYEDGFVNAENQDIVGYADGQRVLPSDVIVANADYVDDL